MVRLQLEFMFRNNNTEMLLLNTEYRDGIRVVSLHGYTSSIITSIMMNILDDIVGSILINLSSSARQLP